MRKFQFENLPKIILNRSLFNLSKQSSFSNLLKIFNRQLDVIIIIKILLNITSINGEDSSKTNSNYKIICILFLQNNTLHQNASIQDIVISYRAIFKLKAD